MDWRACAVAGAAKRGACTERLKTTLPRSRDGALSSCFGARTPRRALAGDPQSPVARAATVRSTIARSALSPRSAPTQDTQCVCVSRAHTASRVVDGPRRLVATASVAHSGLLHDATRPERSEAAGDVSSATAAATSREHCQSLAETAASRRWQPSRPALSTSEPTATSSARGGGNHPESAHD